MMIHVSDKYIAPSTRKMLQALASNGQVATKIEIVVTANGERVAADASWLKYIKLPTHEFETRKKQAEAAVIAENQNASVSNVSGAFSVKINVGCGSLVLTARQHATFCQTGHLLLAAPIRPSATALGAAMGLGTHGGPQVMLRKIDGLNAEVIDGDVTLLQEFKRVDQA